MALAGGGSPVSTLWKQLRQPHRRRAMTIAATVQRHLDDCGIDYEVVEHARTLSSSRTAQVSHVSGDRLAKAVVLRSEGGFTMIVLPASRHLRLGALQDYLDRPVGLATEKEVAQLFNDCELGAVPPVGKAYGMEMIVDDSLNEQTEVFEAVDNICLFIVNAMAFLRLPAEAGQ
jgi:Ala-tRNA(Pro) deacylase